MTYILDTNIAIHLAEGEPDIVTGVEELRGPVFLSVISRIELEGGVHAVPADAALRRIRLDQILETLSVSPFDTAAADAYRRIVESAGYSRRKVFDRMIAAQALANGATLITRNGDDFRDIPGLTMLEW